jgi:hypothetical protein
LEKSRESLPSLGIEDSEFVKRTHEVVLLKANLFYRQTYFSEALRYIDEICPQMPPGM